MNGMDMTVNRLPARTWNWLKMNEARIADMKIEEACPLGLEITGDGVKSTRLEEGSGAWERIGTGMGPDMDQLLEDAATNLLMSGDGGE
ncbi:MAG: hypothetical protein LUE86_06465 [Clostridiales bacterium]|nr:hypothetical protein [Clostridiales bacterium]